MTNAEKYLKDAEALMELPSKLRDYIDSKQLGYVTAPMITDFFVAEAKPFLTEDERVILENIDKKYTHIGRRDGTTGIELYIKSKEDFKHCWCFYNHLFQFIKERRRI